MLSLSARYRPVVRNPLGAGRAAVVVQDRVLGGLCVLKLAPDQSPEGQQLREEGALLSSLAHPHLIQLVDRFRALPLAWAGAEPVSGFVTRWVDGAQLAVALQDRGVEERLRAFAELVSVVGYLHRREILHLDLKPENVLRGEDGVRLLDLGSARSIYAAPGDAGGTLGYAAPEVLVGQAASVAADMYSLGAILYEILAGVPAFGDLTGQALRAAVLAGDVVPLRAVRPDIAPALARLVEELLELDPMARPRSTRELSQRLAVFGASEHPPAGAPPFVGRVAEEAVLRQQLDREDGRLIAVIGAPGSGRTRLVRRLLQERCDAGVQVALDLSMADDPVRALGRLAALGGADLPPPGALWPAAVERGLAAGRGELGVVFMGRREDHGADRLALLDRLCGALVKSGCAVVWASREPLAGAESVPLDGLQVEEIGPIGRFYGVPGASSLREAVVRAGGLPGPLGRALGSSAEVGPTLPGHAMAALSALSSLPSGIPAAVVELMPREIQDAVPVLVERGAARRGEAGELYVDRLRPEGEIPAALRSVLEMAVAGRVPSLDALWVALVAARLGLVSQAAHRLDTALSAAGERRAELLELVSRVADGGDRRARRELARLCLEAGDAARAAATLSGQPDLSPEEHVLLVRALRQQGQVREAVAAIQVAFQAGVDAPMLWLEQARCRLQEGDLDGAAAATREAGRRDPTIAEEEALALEMIIAVHRLDANQEVPGIEDLLARVEERSRRPGFPAATLSAAGRTLIRRGELRRGEQMLACAALQSDAEGSRRTGAGIRLNRANALVRLGQGQDARDVYSEALMIAQDIGASDLLLRITYSLAELELRAGRLPAAERHLAAFRAEAARSDDPETLLRGTLLEARLQLARGQAAAVVELLEPLEHESLPQQLRVARDHYLASAHLDLGQPDRTLAVLTRGADTRNRVVSAQLEALRGRAHLALARQHLARARGMVPDVPDPTQRFEVGEVMLAAAGEDLNPDSFTTRRRDLDEAVRLLRGAPAALAATLRDRLLEGPGADLAGVVELIEAMQNPQAFPGALARLMTEALGAHRVLITLRLPGLGQQLTYKELSGMEAGGISEEVMRRIQRPDDYWLAGNAFADPHLRETSRTVRTFELKSLLAVAIPYGGRAVGALYVDDLVRAERFNMEDVAVLQRLATAVGRVIGLLTTTANPRRRTLIEPVDIFGVLLSDVQHVENIQGALAMLDRARPTNLLVTGPTGAGKTVFAQRIAREVLGLEGVEVLVLRRGEPQWLVAQLAGTRKGEFTGALAHTGAIEKALQGRKALFLDEVQNVGEEGQQILLPLLDLPERRFGGLTGTSHPVPGMLHIILGTNQDVSLGRWASTFREDLWYRMSRVHVHLPALTDRGSEVIYRYLSQLLASRGAPAPEQVFDAGTLHRVTTWGWPGNLRELDTFADNAATMFRRLGRPLGATELPHLIRQLLDDEEIDTPNTVDTSSDRLDQTLLEEVLRALRRVKWVQRDAARELGIQPARLNKILKRYDLMEYVKAQRRQVRDEGAPRNPR